MNTQTITTPAYHSPLDHGKSGKLFVLAASSGVGKTTLVHELCNFFKGTQYPLVRLITYTTRKPRAGEVDGIDYNFINEADFLQKVQGNFFLEWSSAYGALYGSPRSVEFDIKAGRFYIAVLDRDGIRAGIEQLGNLMVPFWIYTDRATQQELLTVRAASGEGQTALRAHLARTEEEAEQLKPLCRFRIKNNVIDEALAELVAIITQEMGLLSGVEQYSTTHLYMQ
jgi:guanylate kinase